LLLTTAWLVPFLSGMAFLQVCDGDNVAACARLI